MKYSILLLSAGLAAVQAANQYEQCGGTGWSGDSSCPGGWTCICQNQYYSQCLPQGSSPGGWNQAGCGSGSVGGNGGGNGGGESAATGIPVVVQPSYAPPSSPTTSAGGDGGNNLHSQMQFYGEPTGFPNTLSTVTTGSPSAPSSASSAGGSSGGSGAVSGGISGQATTTHYFDGQEGACGCGSGGAMSPWQANRADGYFTAAGSQLLFGSDSWCGTGCGKCFQLTSTGQPPDPGAGSSGPANSVMVMVTNLCPAQGNEQWCTSPNQYGRNYHFDIMGAPPGWDNPVVNFQEVACPGSLFTDYKSCICQGGVATSG